MTNTFTTLLNRLPWGSDSVEWKSLSCVCLFRDPLDYRVLGILRARILEWVAIPFSMGFSQPRDRTQVSHNAGRFFTSQAIREDPGDQIMLHYIRLHFRSRFFLLFFFAILGLHCCAWFSLAEASGGSSSLWCVVSSCGAQAVGQSSFSSCSSQA